MSTNTINSHIVVFLDTRARLGQYSSNNWLTTSVLFDSKGWDRSKSFLATRFRIMIVLFGPDHMRHHQIYLSDAKLPSTDSLVVSIRLTLNG